MAANEVRTASGAGMMRALEAHARRPLFDDPLAGRFLSGWPAVVVRNRALRHVFLRLLERSGPGFYGAVVCRTRAIDDACREALATGITQVVILGAGMDTRPYRLAEMATAQVWELDLPAVQEAKKAAVRRRLGRLPSSVRYVPIDLAARLPDGAAEIHPQPALLLCEAVTMYLPPDAVEAVFAYAGTLPEASRFVVTYMPRSVAEDPRHATWARRLRWRAAYDPDELARHLAGHGLRVVADLGAEDYQKRFLRPAGRSLAVFPGERVAVAVR
ncbi:class I SAM-dependent methyltransferase [Paractinoplanes atraurantiacus]|nr:SAM-dependent methyltransferase [Actinoplanes atraurantiacus]